MYFACYLGFSDYRAFATRLQIAIENWLFKNVGHRKRVSHRRANAKFEE